jgi:hypothetical protein
VVVHHRTGADRRALGRDGSILGALHLYLWRSLLATASLAGAHRSERAEDPISARCDVRTSCDVHSRKPVLDRRLAVGHDRSSRFHGPTKPNSELGRAHRLEEKVERARDDGPCHRAWRTLVIYKGLIPRRPDDKIGVAFAYARVGDNARGLDSDIGSFGNFFYPVRSGETMVEVIYQAQWTKWWTVQPEMQYILRPNAWVIALRSTISF